MKHQPTRRGFIKGCSALAAGVAASQRPRFAFADPEQSNNDELLVVIFLNGGLDGLNLVPPIAGNDRTAYEVARPDLKVPVSGTGAALPLDANFGLHPAASPIYPLWQDGRLAFVMAAGLNQAQRSHFDATEYIERGTPGDLTTSTGWLARHFSSAQNLPEQIIMPSISVGSLQATSLLGDRHSVNLNDPGQFNLEVGPWRWRNAQRIALRHMYEADSTWLHQSGLQALDAVDIVDLNTTGDYSPANGAVYPSGTFGNHMEVIAQMTKLDLGLRVATVQLGGWDTHNGQGNGSGGYFASHIEELTAGMNALYTDLNGVGGTNYTQKLTIVVQSEFGRRLRENDDGGTDHGYGNVMMVLGGNVIGGVHGAWPGLETSQLFDNADLDVKTDFRRVLSEILIRRMGNNNLGIIFPGYSNYEPIGIVSGTDLPPNYSNDANSIFSDGFESGDTLQWSVSGP